MEKLTMPPQNPNLSDAYLARQRIDSIVRRTPLVDSPWLSQARSGQVFLKMESLQVTGSFKLRGATNKLSTLTPEERTRGVITVSSGNHGRAVAYVSQKLGVHAVVCVPETVPKIKIEAIRELGAEIIIAGKTYDEANEIANRLKAERGLTMVHPFDDPHIIAGQGTIGLELMEELPEIDSVILKSIKPSIFTAGVTMERGAAMHESLKAGKIVEVVEEPTLADALAGGLGDENKYTFGMIREFVDETVLVSEEEIASAMVFALEKHHLVLEGGGAVGIAALMAQKVGGTGANTVVVLSGSNVSIDILKHVANR
jgi:threonine dehydratase